MEFDFDLNKVLPNDITFVDCKRCPFRKNSPDARLLQKQLDKVIDNLGSVSSKAQSLHSIITSAMKLQHSDHELYILKDAAANGGCGAAVGMIKVGRKKLFLMDIHGIQNEVIPLCVMDFYVHHSRQRTGCGKKLFEHMLKIHNLQPAQVAIDRPSFKFISFLKKHYGLQNSISQSNNFIVFDQFFGDLNAVGYIPRRSQRVRSLSGNQPNNRPPVHPYRRNTVNKEEHPSSSSQPQRLSFSRRSSKEQLMEVDSDEISKTTLPPLANPTSRELSAGSVRSTNSAGSRESSANCHRGLLAQASLYSRHGSADMAAQRPNSRNNQTWSRNAVSAGTIKSLHASSQDNPLAIGYTQFGNESSTLKQHSFSQQSWNRRPNAFQQNTLKTTKQNSNSVSSTGSYTLSSVLNSQKTSSLPSRGTSWNVFGVPSSESQRKASEQTEKGTRRFPF